MPRNQAQNSSAAAVANAVGSIQRKENEYMEGIVFSRHNSSYVAETIAKGGEIETAMMQAAEGMGEDVKQDIKDFLQEQRDRLKKLAIRNVEKEREIAAFIQALNVLRNEVAAGQENEGDVCNYEKSIENKMEGEKRKHQTNMEDVTDTKEYRELCELMGEKLAKKKKGKRSGQNDDSDSDIEIENKGGANLKCPITASWFEEPHKSKLCGHIYSKQAILSYIGTRSHKNCPVAGCNNNQLNKAQLEEDRFTEMKVKKAIRAEEKEKQARLTQAAGVGDSDEEEM
jgi:Zinc-finger of the MIZ type in Nse subunit